MSDSPLRERGFQVVVDTTEVAEWDIADYQLSDNDLYWIARRLARVPHAPADRPVGSVFVREIDGYDIVFWHGREPGFIVVTIGSIRVPDPENPTETLLKRIGDIAILRSAMGI